jgi:RHS repeat-associated protein
MKQLNFTLQVNNPKCHDLISRTILLLLLFCFITPTSTLQAQAVNNQIGDVTMPSPNASSLGKYGDIPVSYYTGVPNVGIPIHTLSEGSISLPISLSYHAGGIKVGEPASWVGQNWSLIAGGMISRTVQGKADESCGGFFTTGNNISTFVRNSDGIVPVRTETCITEVSGVVGNNGLANGTQDGEPDIFSFSVGGYNGKFYIEKPTTVNGVLTKGKAVLIPQQDVSIDYTLGVNGGTCSDVYRIKRFTVTTPEGVKYEFGSCDNSTDAIEIMNNNESGFWMANAWYLKKITSADGVNNIVLNYTPEAYRYNYRVSYGKPSISNPWPKFEGGYSQNTTDISGFRLNYIQTSTEKVTFVAGAERTIPGGDLRISSYNATFEKAKKLDTIKVENGTFCKSFILSQTYFNDDDPAINSGKPEDNRLKLNSIQEKSCDGTVSVPAHIFTYYGKAGKLNYLPNRLSSAIDHWGYNNNAITNPKGFNIPYTKLKYLEKNLPNDVGTQRMEIQGTSNRETDEESMKWGTIQQITYPTGGNTTFEYEANSYWDNEGIKVPNLKNSDTNSYPFIFCANTSQTTSGITRSFTTDDLNNMIFKVEYIGGLTANSTGTPCQSITPSITITAVDVNNPASFCSYIVSGANTSNTLQVTQWEDLKGKFTCLSPNVNYRFDIKVWAAGARFLIYKEETALSNAIRKVGGLRVKKITNNDGISALNDVVKTYEYGTIPTGVLFHKPIYGTVYEGYLGECNVGVAPLYRTINFFMDNSVVPLGSFEGGHINYSAVQENYVVNGVTKYYTVYSYNNEALPAHPLNSQGFVLLPIKTTQPRINSGNLTNKTHWSGDTQSNIATDAYTVNPNDNYVDGIGDYIKFNTYLTYGTSGTPISFWSKYKIRNKPYRLSQVTSVRDGVSTLTSYTYNAGLLPKKTESITNSNSQTTTTTYFYAVELGLTDLINRNMINIPVKVKQQTGNAVKWSRVDYAVFNGINQLEPQNLYESFDATGTNWINRMYISTYTTNGMPSTVYKNGFAVPEIYTWSNKLLTKKEYGTTTNKLTWLIEYQLGTSLVQKVTDENGLVKKFIYDPLMRLTTLQDRMKPDGTDVQATTNYAYHYKGQPTVNAIDINSNFVGTSTTFVNAFNTTPLSTKQYMDGLGRGLSTVRETYTPALQHQKNNMSYDVLGRPDKSYLPFESAVLGYEGAGATQFAFATYELSPLSRPLKQTNVDGTGITMAYGSNAATDYVRKFTFTPVQGAPGTVVNNNIYYGDNELYKTTVWNENGTAILPTATTVGKTEMYKDKLGRTILTRKFLSGQNVDTYNIYDDFSNLVMVIPPAAVDASGNPTASLVFTYSYDVRNRLVEKKVPSSDPQKFFYDSRDFLIFVQDGNMRTAKNPTTNVAEPKHLATVYDEIGRPIKTGFVLNYTPTLNIYGNLTTDATNLITDKLTETIYYDNRTWVKHQGAKVLKPTGVTTEREFVWSYIERRVGIEYTGNPVWTGKQHLLSKTYVNGASPPVGDGPITDYDYGGVDWMVSAYDGSQKPTISYNYLYSGPSTTRAQEVRTSQSFEYDNGQRLKQSKYMYALNGAGVVAPTFILSNLNYNFKDQVIEKNTAFVNNKYLQSMDYTYNNRGWLTSINSGFLPSTMDYPIFGCSTATSNTVAANYASLATSGYLTPPINSGESNPDLFKEIIRYNDPVAALPNSRPAQRNGNISQIEWQVAGREAQAYSFNYDDLDRLTEANYTDIHAADWSTKGWTSQYTSDNKFKETASYDIRGNIQNLNRNGMSTNGLITVTVNSVIKTLICGYFAEIDNLSYTYDPNDKNKLHRVNDIANYTSGFKSVNGTVNAQTTPQYAYDTNGNLISDMNKGITNITYNHLNLPLVITFTNDASNQPRRIEFIYDATGAKLRKTVYTNNVITEKRDYVNGIEYKGDVLDRFAHTEGAVVRNENTVFEHQYVIKDHLGNARITYRDGINKVDNTGNTTLNDGTIVAADMMQINHYYPFGMNMEGNWNGLNGKNKYQYNEKELNSDFGLDLSDYGARFYDAAIGRFNSIDIMGEGDKKNNSYSFCKNNPIRYIDVEGKIVIDPVLEKRFPSFVGLLKAMVEIYKNKPAAYKQALQQYSELTDAEIIKYLTVGKEGPRVSSANLDKENANGVTEQNSPFNIFINERILNLYEHANGELAPLYAKIYEILESTFFHEFTHYGDMKKDGKLTQSEYKGSVNVGKEGGKRFEMDFRTYGKDNTMDDINQWLNQAQFQIYSTQNQEEKKKKDEQKKKDEKKKNPDRV